VKVKSIRRKRLADHFSLADPGGLMPSPMDVYSVMLAFLDLLPMASRLGVVVGKCRGRRVFFRAESVGDHA
jgi:hypothetical protein